MSQPFFTLRAPAKVNLTLTITGRRLDGYHLLDSLFVFCDLCDSIAVEPSQTLAFAVPSGPFASQVEHDGGNLVMRAARLLQRESATEYGALLSLTKNIPVAAGLGGGSADAAATLLALNQHWRLAWPLERLHGLAAVLGADVPACLASKPVMAGGIGDDLSSAPLMPDCTILLLNPGVATPTPAVFKAFKQLRPEITAQARPAFPSHVPNVSALVEAIAARGNDLQQAAITVAPVISEVLATLAALPDVAYCAMSGSGATCFALFETPAHAAEAQRRLSRSHPHWWSWQGGWYSGNSGY